MNMLTRLLMPLLAILVAAQPVAAAPFRLILTHLEPPLVPNSVMDMALEKGYFAAEGVDVELVRVEQTPSALQALMAGEGEMANVGVDALLVLVARGTDDLRAVLSPNKSLPYVIVASDGISSVGDLTGHRFGIGRVGSLDHSLSTRVLADKGVDIDATELLAIGQPAARAQALLAGQIDATTMSNGVWLSVPDKIGFHILVDQQAYYAAAPVINKVNVVPQSVLDERGPEVRAVIRAIIRMSRDFAGNSGSWAAAMAPHAPNIQTTDLLALDDGFAGSWSVNGGMNRRELQYTQDWLYSTEDFDALPAIDLDHWVDFGPLDSVLAELGIVDGDPVGR